MQRHRAILTAVLGLGLASTTAAGPLTLEHIPAITGLCREMGGLSAAITRTRDLGVSRAEEGQSLLERMRNLTTLDPATRTLVWETFTMIYDDTAHVLTPGQVQAVIEDRCMREFLNAIAK